MEMQQTSAIGGRTLRKNRHMLPFIENLGDLFIDDLGVATTTSP